MTSVTIGPSGPNMADIHKLKMKMSKKNKYSRIEIDPEKPKDHNTAKEV